jgi:hypothetical protein
LSSGVISISRSGFSVSRKALALIRSSFFQALQPLFDLAQIADHEIEIDVLNVAQWIDRADMRNRVVLKRAQYVNERIHLAQVADVGSLFQRVLADGTYVHVFDRGVRELLRVIERGQLVEALIWNLGDSHVGFTRVRKRVLGEIRLGQNSEQR